MTKSKKPREFVTSRIRFFHQNGQNLRDIYPEIVDEYDVHSILKVIAISYYIEMGLPIVYKHFKEKYHAKITYVETMAGSGVIKASSVGDCFCGSCTGAVLSAISKGYPIERVIAVDINPKKCKALEARLKYIDPNLDKFIIPGDINSVSNQIASLIKKKTMSFIVIDPEGFEGLSWRAINPLLESRSDIMLTWFEGGLDRMRASALTDHNGAESTADRLTELLGSEDWKNARNGLELTDIFINRVKKETDRNVVEYIGIEDEVRKHYKLILLLREFPQSRKLASEWKKYMDKWLQSGVARKVKWELEKAAGKQEELDKWMT